MAYLQVVQETHAGEKVAENVSRVVLAQPSPFGHHAEELAPATERHDHVHVLRVPQHLLTTTTRGYVPGML